MKKLTLKADVITPNLTELCFFADEYYAEVIKISEGKKHYSRNFGANGLKIAT